jgi:hypothetical protein
VREVAGIGGGLGPNIPKLKIYLRQQAGLVEARAASRSIVSCLVSSWECGGRIARKSIFSGFVTES